MRQREARNLQLPAGGILFPSASNPRSVPFTVEVRHLGRVVACPGYLLRRYRRFDAGEIRGVQRECQCSERLGQL